MSFVPFKIQIICTLKVFEKKIKDETKEKEKFGHEKEKKASNFEEIERE